MEAEATFTLSINGQNYAVDVPPDRPLPWLLRDVVG
jgi:aerobic-type carbon monoxide dehydrogenase small subunit (CoxS/CutS family)